MGEHVRKCVRRRLHEHNRIVAFTCPLIDSRTISWVVWLVPCSRKMILKRSVTHLNFWLLHQTSTFICLVPCRQHKISLQTFQIYRKVETGKNTFPIMPSGKVRIPRMVLLTNHECRLNSVEDIAWLRNIMQFAKLRGWNYIPFDKSNGGGASLSEQTHRLRNAVAQICHYINTLTPARMSECYLCWKVEWI